MTQEDRQLVGHVAVDSGQIMIVDPCYLLAGKAYNAVRESIMEGEHEVEVPEKAHEGAGCPMVAHHTQFGDGFMPVYRETVDGRMRLVIELDGHTV